MWFARCREIGAVISGLRNDDLEKPTRLLAEAQAMRAAVLEKQSEIMQQLDVHPVSLPNRVAIDREHDRQRDLRTELARLLRGELWRAPGVTYPQLTVLDERIAALTEKVDRLTRRHDAYVAQARALVGAETEGQPSEQAPTGEAVQVSE
jgi:hypothetical protein